MVGTPPAAVTSGCPLAERALGRTRHLGPAPGTGLPPMAQGWKVPGQVNSIEIPKRLLAYVETGTRLDATLHDTVRDSYILSGSPVTDADALSQMDIPDHETCVEVGKVQEGDADGAAA